MRKLYIFDMGGVVALNTNVVPDIAEYLGISMEEWRAWSKDLGFAFMEGKFTAMKFWEIFSQRSGLVMKEELFGKFFHPGRNEPVYSLIRELKKHNRVVCGSNSIEEHYAIHITRGDYTIFDAVYASHRIGFVKPHSEFYQHILEQEDFPPFRTIFIDDTFENVEAAQRLGICSLHFTGYERLVEQLTGL